MLAVVQTIAGSIGGVTGTSVQGAIRRRYGMFWACVAIVPVVAINIFTLTADIQAGALALTLLTGVAYQYFVLPFAGIVGWLLVSQRYVRIERVLAVLPFIFLAYGASAILAKADWGLVARAIVLPQFHFSAAFIGAALALLGTTLTAYVYMWQSVEVAERAPGVAQLRTVRVNATLGMAFATLTFLFILVATGATLGKHHIAVLTAVDAALALKPLAGSWASTLFAVGLLGSALVAVPVIAGTTGYVAAHTFGWPGTLNSRFQDARAFYVVILASLAAAAAICFAGFSLIPLLYVASLAAGLATPITLFFAVCLARDKATMGDHPINPWLAGAGWVVTAIMSTASILYLIYISRS
jgi:Mn2+/Fe2+ NRAMP family transporter